jgi:hypothetical protein
MGLDVYLYQFKDVDVDAILKLAQFSEDPATSKTPGAIAAKARELGFSEKIISEPGFGGTQISYPSKTHPEWPVGEWYSFGRIRAILRHFYGKDIYFIFPEAKDLHGLFRPDWEKAKNRLVDIFQELKDISPPTWQEVYPFETPDSATKQLEVMIETLDFVLNSGNPKEFLLFWSE